MVLVQGGIKLIDNSTQKVRDSIKYVKSSQARKEKFAASCTELGITIRRSLHGDVTTSWNTTSWNSTFYMLDDALFYKKPFDHLEGDICKNFQYHYRPNLDEWRRIEILAKFLRPFDEITKMLSGSKYPTSNLYFRCVVEVHVMSNDSCFSKCDFMTRTISSMRKKFNKYWEKYSLILGIVTVLDPCYKLEDVEWGSEQIYPEKDDLIFESVTRVKLALEQLYDEYKSMPKEHSNSQDGLDTLVEDPFASWAKQKKGNIDENSQLEQYLVESRKPWARDYNVLTYWKGCDNQFRDMSHMARDIVAIPVSTVASESSFDAAGRVLDKYRSRLLPKNVETLVCLRDWMYNMDFGARNEQAEDAEELAEVLKDVLSSEPAPYVAFTSKQGSLSMISSKEA